MKKLIITNAAIEKYHSALILAEKSPATADSYARQAARLAAFLDDAPVSRQQILRFKEHLLETGYKPATINTIICGVNHFLRFLGMADCAIKLVKIQRKAFSDPSRELQRPEYEKLLEAARRQGRKRSALILETIAGTGIRISELKYITAGAVRRGRTEIYLKGKVRTIIIPKKLAKKLAAYAEGEGIKSGPVFITRAGNPISRKAVWAEMKRLALAAGIPPSKVFPHNLRHLFARSFYKICRDIAKLADVLGHSSIETTRLYLVSSGREHARNLEKMGLVS